VRELKNVIERAVILSPGKSLRLDLSMPELKFDDEPAVPAEPRGEEPMTEKEMREFQKTNLIKALERADWKVSGKGGAAELLGVRPTTLADRIRTFRIKRPAR
jgi:transcriptional regulator with GAF, ATPase, and Fis domain